jgi:PAS domain S-box-containing protein
MLNMMEDMENEIKERKQTEILLDKTSKQIKLILDVAGEGILGIDLKGLITFVNPKASEILGYKSDELLGKQGHSTFHHSYHDCSPYPENNCPNYKTLNEGKDYSGEDYFWRKDRTGFYVSYSSSPIYGEGIITGAVITFIDITNRKEFEKSIIEKSNELERFNNIMVDREIRMIALKKEINELLKKQGNNEKYKIAE